MHAVLTVSMQKSWWSSGMIPKKVTWVQFAATISTVCSKLLQNNDLVFQFLVKHRHICSYKFPYRISDQEISDQEFYVSSATFLQFFHPFMLI